MPQAAKKEDNKNYFHLLRECKRTGLCEFPHYFANSTCQFEKKRVTLHAFLSVVLKKACIFHIYPTHGRANTARGSSPFH